MRRVRAGCKYRYEPVLIDRIDPTMGKIKPGLIVRVVNKPGCPKANTMGHCYIETLEGKFLGMVATSSLKSLRK